MLYIINTYYNMYMRLPSKDIDFSSESPKSENDDLLIEYP